MAWCCFPLLLLLLVLLTSSWGHISCCACLLLAPTITLQPVSHYLLCLTTAAAHQHIAAAETPVTVGN
jgi:hypothetical protein